jgi:hypothetical protein
MEENVTPVSTRSAGMKFGMISGLIGIALFLVSAITGMNPFQGVLSWIGIAISIALLFLAQKSFKDNGDGFMSYGQGVGIGFWFTLISTLLSVAVMYVYVTFIDGAPMELFYEEQASKMEGQGQSEEAIEMALEWTRKLFWIFAIIGTIFWGMIIALILTIFTQKKHPEPTF